MKKVTIDDYKKSIELIHRELEDSDYIDRDAVKAACDTIEEYVSRLNYLDHRINTPNLPYFLLTLDRLIKEDKIADYGACYFNLKDFTQINHQFGQDEGTQILEKYFKEFQEMLDTDGWVCSAGGDSGLVVFNLSMLEQVMTFLRGKTLISPASGERAYLEAVTGYNTHLSNYTHAGDIMNTLSPTMNIAKNVRHVPEVFFNEKMEKEVKNSRRILRIFPKAIKDEEFQVFYQPKVELRGYTMAGAEALCRWIHEGSMIFPDQFIPVLENDGVAIRRLDFYMLDHVCKDIKRWMDAGIDVVPVSVNLSRCHLGKPNLLDEITDIIDSNLVPRRLLQIELTETTADADYADIKNLVIGLQVRGIGTAIDDFGTGYSSLTLIKDLPWKVLKIDKAFIKNAGLGGDTAEEHVLRHVIGMFQELNIECVAEGVETADHVRLLKANDCYMAQGYFFDKPLRKDIFEKKLIDSGKRMSQLFG